MIVIDSRFPKPRNVIDLRDEEEQDVFYDFSSPFAPTPGTDEPDSDIPMPPSSFIIVSQTVKILEDGNQVVDVILELPDDNAVREYDIRIAKKA